MPFMAFLFLAQAPPASSILLSLCHRRQDLVAVASGTEGVADVVSGATDLQGWSEDWYVTAERPPDGASPPLALWHARIDHAPLSVDSAQAGYQPSIVGAGVGDRRRVPDFRTRVTIDWWPVYEEGTRGPADALARAKARWVDPIYSAGRAMTLDEWVAFTGFRGIKPAWFDPTPLPWAGLAALGAVRTVTWRKLPIATSAPYDAAIGPAAVSDREAATRTR